MNQQKTRLNNFELLRIISIFMVLVLHSLVFTGILNKYSNVSGNYFLVWMLESFAFVAVNCFILISGYFLVDSKFKLEKVLKLWIKVFFYSFIIYLALLIFGISDFSYESFFKSLFPVVLGNYWFFTCYIVLYLLSPFINKLINSLNKDEYKKLLLLITLIFPLWSTFVPNINTINYGGSYSISWFIVLYLVAGYLKKHFDKNVGKMKLLLLYVSMCLINIINSFIVHWFHLNYSHDLFYNYYSITVFLASIFLFLFLFFKSVNIKSSKLNKIIPVVSSSAFGIYLIHENPNIRYWLWQNIYDKFLSDEVFFLVPKILIVDAIAFLCLLLIDKICSLLIRLIDNKLLNLIKRLKEGKLDDKN